MARPILKFASVWILAVVLLAGGGCCAPSEHSLGCVLDRLCTCDPLKINEPPVCFEIEACEPDGFVIEQPLAYLAQKCRWRPGQNVQPGPPPISYRPPRPPTFLPVPTQPIFAAVNLAAPESSRGAVEVDFGTRLMVPGRD